MRTLPADAQIHTGVIGQDLVYDTPSPGSLTLKIDQFRYFANEYDTIQKMQSDLDFMNIFAMHYAELLKIAIEQNVFASIYAQGDTTNLGATAGAKQGAYNLGTAGAPVHVDASNIVQVVGNAMTCLAENNVPPSSQTNYGIFPPAVMNLFHQSELRQAYLTGDANSIIREKIGYVGTTVSGARMHMSNLLTSGVDSGSGKYAYHCPFGDQYALTFATQITEREVIPNPKRFGKLLRQMQVFGYKTIKPVAMGDIYLTLA